MFSHSALVSFSCEVEFACVGVDVGGDTTHCCCSDTIEALQGEEKGGGN